MKAKKTIFMKGGNPISRGFWVFPLPALRISPDWLKEVPSADTSDRVSGKQGSEPDGINYRLIPRLLSINLGHRWSRERLPVCEAENMPIPQRGGVILICLSGGEMPTLWGEARARRDSADQGERCTRKPASA